MQESLPTIRVDAATKHRLLLRTMLHHRYEMCFPSYEPAMAWYALAFTEEDKKWRPSLELRVPTRIGCVSCGACFGFVQSRDFFTAIVLQDCHCCTEETNQTSHRFGDWNIIQYHMKTGIPVWWIKQTIAQIIEEQYGRKIEAAIAQQQSTPT